MNNVLHKSNTNCADKTSLSVLWSWIQDVSVKVRCFSASPVCAWTVTPLQRMWNKKVQLSPDVVSAVCEGGNVVLLLDQPLKDAEKLYEFEVAESNGRFVNAEARAEGDKVIIKSPVANPAKVRHAWKNNPARVNAYSENGLPLVPFQIEIGPQK